ncbi:MAG: hypothetical protein CVU39_25950 [Chloroflexi bacterium HGW-Chloroflexi-10]|nr:MAG: hypothetical protein CVU39_25950 [Chloroflexi bacterium HGW-Chloroflexi-10]
MTIADIILVRENKESEMLTQLKRYYDEVGILSTNFHCQYFDQCVSEFKDLVKGKSAYVGSRYEEHSLPRILFVSLDMGSDDSFETPQQRTPQGVRAVEENRYWQQFNPLNHWYATHKLAVLIAQVFEPQLTYQDANSIFAHTNSAKCCPVKSGKEMAPAVLYRNCRHYMHDELEILNPDIIVSQGTRAMDAVHFSTENISHISEYQIISKIHERIEIVKINQHPVLLINSIFPSWRNDRTRKQEKELYPFYLQAAKVFTSFVHL